MRKVAGALALEEKLFAQKIENTRSSSLWRCSELSSSQQESLNLFHISDGPRLVSPNFGGVLLHDVHAELVPGFQNVLKVTKDNVSSHCIHNSSGRNPSCKERIAE